ncbi:hypothetical protein N9N67_05195 [Bacteriovoracaceae bacterium]|nr:hypothetical protein [Bacteriovoracaceae bacterium]
MIKFYLILGICTMTIISAKPITCPNYTQNYPYTDEQIINYLNELKKEYFSHEPEFVQTKIKLKDYRNKAYYLATKPNLVGNLFRKKKRSKKNKTTYIINRSIYFKYCGPGPLAMKAILLHELKHLYDYYLWNKGKTILFGLKYLLSKKFHMAYEKRTDCFSLKANPEFQKGLAQYRKWVVEMIRLNAKNPLKKIKAKNTIYYSEAELKDPHFNCKE